MSTEPEQSRTATTLSLVVGLAMIGFAVWVVAGSGLFSTAPDPMKKASPEELAKAFANDDPLEALPRVAAVNTPVPDTEGDPLMAEIVQKLNKATAVPNEALLTFRSKAALAQFLRVAKDHGLEVVGTVDDLNAVRVRFTSPEKLRDYLAASGQDRPLLDANQWMTVPRLAKPDGSNQGGVQPSGVGFLEAINAQGDRTGWGRGVTVAVLDTGVQANPTFGAGQVTHVDLVNDGTPMHPHGTSIASLIAGQDDRVPGVSPSANILDMRVANDKGYSVTSVLSQGIVQATDMGAQVINISMGGYDDSQVLRQAVAYALQHNVIVVAAAGNDGLDVLAYPAAINGVLGIGAVDATNKQAYFSNSGAGLSFVAPGVGLPVAWSTDKMAIASGTSQAAAVVSGGVAYELGLGLPPQEALRQLDANAKATGAPQNQVGRGVLQVHK